MQAACKDNYDNCFLHVNPSSNSGGFRLLFARFMATLDGSRCQNTNGLYILNEHYPSQWTVYTLIRWYSAIRSPKEEESRLHLPHLCSQPALGGPPPRKPPALPAPLARPPSGRDAARRQRGDEPELLGACQGRRGAEPRSNGAVLRHVATWPLPRPDSPFLRCAGDCGTWGGGEVWPGIGLY